MFIGKYYHTIDEHGRVSLPVDFRSQNSSWIVTRGLDGGLIVFDETTFLTTLNRLKSKPFTKKSQRDLTRLLTNEAKPLEADKQGRVVLPEYLTEFAGLKHAIVWVGSFDYIEIWDRDRYHDYVAQLEPRYEEIAEEFDESS